MDDALVEVVLDRLNAEPLPQVAADVLLAAMEGEEALSAQLGADPGQRPAARDGGGPSALPAGAFLRSLTVSGFRGIGPSAVLDVVPGPGLTLVVGRNGSGKSSFAEALEILLTGTLMRWAKAPAVVRDGWRSRHSPGLAEIRAEFLIEGSGPAAAGRSWPAEASIDASASWLQRPGEKRTGIGELGWARPLEEYRPFLSHAELEAFFGRPSELHDLLAAVLGLDDLDVAAGRLNAARKERDDALAAIRQRLAPLRDRLGALEDERARICLAALNGSNWDIAAAASAATGTEPPAGGELEVFRRAALLTAPAGEDVARAVTSLREAAAGLDAVAGTAAGQALALAALLEAAVNHHAAHGDGPCPVCGRDGALTPQWAAETREHMLRLREQAAAAEEAASTAKIAAEKALVLLQPPPDTVTQPAIAVLDEGQTAIAWRQWARRPPEADLTDPAGLRSLADHLETLHGPLEDAIRDLAAQASADLARRDDRWVPVAADVAAWCADAGPARDAATAVSALKLARTWLVKATNDLRNARLAPLADQAREIWAMLRQESNVDLGAFRLAGSSTQRKLELDVSIDGTPGAALGVMSQGEINALALSIFLPRTTMPRSPFRFMVIDDPVQAMDPAKVDGLARVLQEVAADRQVIVFTHDTRLATAVRDLAIPATILEVTRRPGSVVQVRSCLDPAAQALEDAGALGADSDVPAQVAARVIPGLCRTAVEAAFAQAVWRRQLRVGQAREEIAADLADASRSLTKLAALALTGTTTRGGDVLPMLNRMSRSCADTFQALNKGAHQAHQGDLRALISGSRDLVSKIGAAQS